jgi:predicted O-linked N-acetylglucosamine transferase (SPINDLY family)
MPSETLTRTGLSFAALLNEVESVTPYTGRCGAIALYRDWIDANGPHTPHLFAAWFNLGTELENLGDPAGAEQCYRSCLALRCDFMPAITNLLHLLEQSGRIAEAIALIDQALQPPDTRTSLINNRARVLETAKRLDEAEDALDASLRIDPDQPDVMQHWLHVRQKRCRWPIFPGPDFVVPHETLIQNAGPLSALALFDDVTQQSDICRIWIERKTEPAPERLSPPSGYRHDRIRIGYMSSDFCQHAMSLLIAELFERHDRSRFEVFGYCSSPEDGTDIRKRVIASFDRFARIAELPDEAAARLIRADEIDILIDLNGLTAGARLRVMRWRPAPVQATYLGFIGPIPLPELDYLLCDSFVIPPETAPLYQPKPLYIAEIYQANDSKRARAAHRSRAEVRLPDDRFVFCCFSNHYKITEAMFTAWLEILRRVPDSILWLASDNPWSVETLRHTAQQAGIDPARIIVMPRVSPADYLSCLAVADLFLDTFPYNAGTIASDAIRMQVPLVTLMGQSFVSRMAGRLLTAIGATEGVTSGLDDYIETAVALASNPARHAAYKACFTDAAWDATVGNIAKFTAEFERTLGTIVLAPGA